MEHGERVPSRSLAGERLEAPRRIWKASTVEAHHAGSDFKLSVAMAAHNEVRTVGEAISSVLTLDVPFEIELIVVDDGSTDGTSDVIRSFRHDPRLVTLTHPECRGKGAALLSAAGVATGSHLLVFDADLEYSADDIASLVEPVLEGTASVVYGARVPGMRTAFHSFRYALGSKVTTVLANVIFDSWLTDIHTCLKLMPLRLFRELSLSEAGFGLDTEITAEMLRRGIRPYEVPCSYRGRSVAAGKQLSPRDGLSCVKVLAQVRLRGIIDYDLASLDRLRMLPGEGAAATPELSETTGNGGKPRNEDAAATVGVTPQDGRRTPAHAAGAR